MRPSNYIVRSALSKYYGNFANLISSNDKMFINCDFGSVKFLQGDWKTRIIASDYDWQ